METILNLLDLQDGVDTYLADLTQFMQQHGLESFLQAPIDHMAIKAEDTHQFDDYLGIFSPLSESMSYIEMNDRRLATAELINPLEFQTIGECRTLEIMEPRPEKVGMDIVGFEHIEMYHEPLEKIEETLKAKNIPYEFTSNPEHRALVVVINDKGQEIKFTDKSLAQIVARQVKDKEATIVK